MFCRKFHVSKFGKTSWRNSSVLCFGKFPVAKKIMVKSGGGKEGLSRFSIATFLFHSAGKFRRGIL